MQNFPTQGGAAPLHSPPGGQPPGTPVRPIGQQFGPPFSCGWIRPCPWASGGGGDFLRAKVGIEHAAKYLLWFLLLWYRAIFTTGQKVNQSSVVDMPRVVVYKKGILLHNSSMIIITNDIKYNIESLHRLDLLTKGDRGDHHTIMENCCINFIPLWEWTWRMTRFG